MSDGFPYRELYHYDSGRSLVMDEVSGDIFYSKSLTHYDRAVYEFLSTNSDRHVPRVIRLIDQEDGKLTVIEEYIRGNTFDTVIDDPDMPKNDKLSYFIDLLEGLKFLHSAPKPIIHRDLKPSNIMVRDKGQVVIIDYDAAKVYKPGEDKDTVALGTEGRAAPEQYGFMQSDVRTDIYAVGRMLKDAFPSDARIQKIADKAMSFDPDGRYENAGQFENALLRRVSVNANLKPLFPPPGFRTMTWWKVPLAVMGYPLMIYIGLGISTREADPMENLITKIFFLIYWFTVVDITNSWTGIYDVLPFIDDKRIYIRWPVKLIYSITAFFVMLIPFILASGLAKIIPSWFNN